MKPNNFLIFLLLILLVTSCNSTKEDTIKNDFFEISDINFLSNHNDKLILFDYENAIDQGFILPSKKQIKNGYFNLSFKLKPLKDNQKFYYKIYYQNESYKFPEYEFQKQKELHPLAHENFYGSWEDTEIEFKSIPNTKIGEEIMISDSFRIVGNPRNEEMCFFEGENDRWKRNPRVGTYSAMLIISTEKGIENLPDYIKNISKTNNNSFINPYYYFLYGEGADNQNYKVILEPEFITTKASPNLGNGLYVENSNFKNSKNPHDHYTCNCNNSDSINNNATISQFIHYVDNSAKLYNIPLIRDVINEGYSKEEYNWYRAFFSKEELIGILPQTAKDPCQTVFSNPENNTITLKNPKSEYGKWQKENVGIITRHGFTYGKYTVKANLTELLNKDNVWNGITNAIWLIYQGGSGQEKGWNLRRPCTKEGYMETYWGGRFDNRVERVAYSEIDFEILKTVHYCPNNIFPPLYENYEANQNSPEAWNTKLPEEVNKYDSDIAVCCTNWDMACWQPENFGTGCQEISYNGQTFLAHRWEDVYRAITEKHMANDDELFGSDYYYFQIDWQPDKIIWRIGPEKDQLYEVGYMDDKITSIPNNQMLLIITQEFHNTNWWPGSPYDQHNIPFPKNEITGTIYEITIE